MKKVLSFVLVLAMILGTVSMAFAAPYTTAMTKINATNTAVPFEDAQDNYVTTILRDLGAIEGDNGKINAAGELTRAEAAALVVKAMGLGDQGAVKTTTKFADVKKDAWYSGYVAVAAANGYVEGNGGKFNPDAKLTMDEAVALMLKVLGYSDAHLEGIWPANFRDLALAKNILTDVEVGTQVATRGDMFQVLFNCLDEDLVVWKETTSDGGKYGQSTNGLTLLKKMTRVSDAYKYATSEAMVLTENVTFVNKFDASDFYGKTVVLLTKNGSENYIGIYSCKTKEVTGKFAANDSFATFTAIDGTVYTGLATTAATELFINGGKSSDAFDLDDVDKTVTYTLDLNVGKTNPEKNASIVGIKYEKIDYTYMVNVTEAALIADANLYKFDNSSAVRAGLKLFPLTTAGLKKNAVLDEKYDFEVVGAVDSLDEIKEDDIVELYVNPNTTYVQKVVVTRDVVKGAITKYDSKNAKYTVNGTAYSVGTTVAPITDFTDNVANAIKGATEYALYLNAAGKIAFAEFVDEEAEKLTYRYAFVLEAKTADAEWSYNEAKKTFKAVSNASIRLLPLDTMVEEEFTLCSGGAVTGTAVLLNGYKWVAADDKITPTALVYFAANSKGELAYLSMANSLTAEKDIQNLTTVTTLSSIGFVNGSDALLYKDAKVYTPVKTKAITSAAYWTVKEVADLNKATSKAVDYKANKQGYVEFVVVYDYSVAPTVEKVTVAAITGYDVDANGTYVTFVQPGKAEESLYVSAGATGIDKTLKLASLTAFTLKNGKIAAAETANVADTYTIVEDTCELVFDGAQLVKNENAAYIKLYEAKFMKWDATNKVLVNLVDEEEINEALAKVGAIVDLYKLYQANYFDVVVIR